MTKEPTVVTSEHTYARIAQILDEIEDLRLEMGRRRDARVTFQVQSAAPREVLYHSLTVHRKANQLCVELGADSAAIADVCEAELAQPSDVLRVLDSVCERLATARVSLRIEGDSYKPDLAGPLMSQTGKEPGDVLTGCLLASRQLNTLLDHAFAPAEAHELLVRAVRVTHRVLAHAGVAPPPIPPLERRKAPRDVFQVLWQCGNTLRGLMQRCGFETVEFERGYVGEDPSDVYDFAALILSELEFIEARTACQDQKSEEIETPAPVLPSHNYRLAKQLRDATNILASYSNSNPGWI